MRKRNKTWKEGTESAVFFPFFSKVAFDDEHCILCTNTIIHYQGSVIFWMKPTSLHLLSSPLLGQNNDYFPRKNWSVSFQVSWMIIESWDFCSRNKYYDFQNNIAKPARKALGVFIHSFSPWRTVIQYNQGRRASPGRPLLFYFTYLFWICLT